MRIKSAEIGVIAFVLLLPTTMRGDDRATSLRVPPRSDPLLVALDRACDETITSAAAPEKRPANGTFWLLTATSYGLTVLDIELTQHCIHKGTCKEGNPLLSEDRGKAYALQMSLTTAKVFTSYWLRKRAIADDEDARVIWWLPQAIVIGSHALGAGVGLKFLF